MIICVPVEKLQEKIVVCESFGRTPYFLIYDSSSKERKILDNEAARSQGGAGPKAAQLLIDNNVESLLAFRCGQNAADVLTSGNVKIYKIRENDVDKAIEDFLEGKYELLTEIHEGFHNHG